MLNDARVASTWLYVRTCQRVRNIKNIATIRDFQLYIRVNSTTNIKWLNPLLLTTLWLANFTYVCFITIEHIFDFHLRAKFS